MNEPQNPVSDVSRCPSTNEEGDRCSLTDAAAVHFDGQHWSDWNCLSGSGTRRVRWHVTNDERARWDHLGFTPPPAVCPSRDGAGTPCVLLDNEALHMAGHLGPIENDRRAQWPLTGEDHARWGPRVPTGPFATDWFRGQVQVTEDARLAALAEHLDPALGARLRQLLDADDAARRDQEMLHRAQQAEDRAADFRERWINMRRERNQAWRERGAARSRVPIPEDRGDPRLDAQRAVVDAERALAGAQRALAEAEGRA
jgi:hypothetical protein